jgi:hypothetical protein
MCGTGFLSSGRCMEILQRLMTPFRSASGFTEKRFAAVQLQKATRVSTHVTSVLHVGRTTMPLAGADLDATCPAVGGFRCGSGPQAAAVGTEVPELPTVAHLRTHSSSTGMSPGLRSAALDQRKKVFRRALRTSDLTSCVSAVLPPSAGFAYGPAGPVVRQRKPIKGTHDLRGCVATSGIVKEL